MLQIRVETFEQTGARARERARKMNRGERLIPERSLVFETIEDMMEVLSRERIRLCVTARENLDRLPLWQRRWEETGER